MVGQAELSAQETFQAIPSIIYSLLFLKSPSPEFVEVVAFVGLLEDLFVDVVDDAIPFARFDTGGDEVVFFNRIFECLEAHAVDLHAFDADCFFLH